MSKERLIVLVLDIALNIKDFPGTGYALGVGVRAIRIELSV